MHESTVSRVTTNKYIATPRGLFELQIFLHRRRSPAADGGDGHSAEAVRSRIKALIDAEPADGRPVRRPASSRCSRSEGVDIARRTVAKYREAMRIPSSVQRRREKSLAVAA